MSTMPTSGRTRATRVAILPRPLAPISTIRKRVCSVTSSMVIGAPTSLLNEPRGATVSPARSQMARSRFLVVVLPLEPVTAITWSRPRARTWATTSEARAPSARTTSGTTIWLTGRSRGLSTSSSAAPACWAAGAKAWPSVTSPGLATKMEPFVTSRESVCTDPSTTVSSVSVPCRCSTPETTVLMWWSVRAIIYSQPAS